MLLNNEEFTALPEVQALKQQEEQLGDGECLGKAEAEMNHDDIPSGSNTNGSDASIPSRQSIENNLRQKMASLQAEYNGRLSGMISQAKAEYIQARKGQKKISNSALARKYMGLAEAAEAECDARVYAAIAYAENELNRYNYSTGITEEARMFYQRAKSQRRSQLLNSIGN